MFLIKVHAALDRGGALRGGRVGNLPSLLVAFFNIHVIDIFTTYCHFKRRETLGLRPFVTYFHNYI